MKCIGVYQNHRLYYDDKHDEYLLLTPNFRFTCMFGHCNNRDVANWAYREKDKHKTRLENKDLNGILFYYKSSDDGKKKLPKPEFDRGDKVRLKVLVPNMYTGTIAEILFVDGAEEYIYSVADMVQKIYFHQSDLELLSRYHEIVDGGDKYTVKAPKYKLGNIVVDMEDKEWTIISARYRTAKIGWVYEIKNHSYHKITYNQIKESIIGEI